LRSVRAIRARANPTTIGFSGRARAQTGGGSRRRVPRRVTEDFAEPPVGKSRPASIFKVVVLPAPFGPRNPTSSPGSILETDFVDGDGLFVLAAEKSLDRAGKTRLLFVSAEGFGEIVDLDDGHLRVLNF